MFRTLVDVIYFPQWLLHTAELSDRMCPVGTVDPHKCIILKTTVYSVLYRVSKWTILCSNLCLYRFISTHNLETINLKEWLNHGLELQKHYLTILPLAIMWVGVENAMVWKQTIAALEWQNWTFIISCKLYNFLG